MLWIFFNRLAFKVCIKSSSQLGYKIFFNQKYVISYQINRKISIEFRCYLYKNNCKWLSNWRLNPWSESIIKVQASTSVNYHAIIPYNTLKSYVHKQKKTKLTPLTPIYPSYCTLIYGQEYITGRGHLQHCVIFFPGLFLERFSRQFGVQIKNIWK